MGIYVHGHLHISLFNSFDDLTQWSHRGVRGEFDQKVIPPAVLETLDDAGCGAEDLRVGQCGPKTPRRFIGNPNDRSVIRPGELDVYKLSERRVVRRRAFGDRVLVKRTEIVQPRGLNGDVRRAESLNDDAARSIASTGPSGNLGKQLKSSFGRSEFRKIQRDIGRDDANECHVGKIETFCDDLRTDEHIQLSASECSEYRLECAFALRNVAIQPRNFRIREQRLNRLFDFFRADSDGV